MRFIFSVLFLFGLLQVAPAAPGGHSIKVKINGLKDSVCYIGHYFGKGQYIAKDTAKADKSGNIVFAGKEELPGGIYVLVLPKRYIEFIIGEQSFSLETDTAQPVMHMKVTGSPENTLFFDFQKFMTRKGKSADSLRKIMSTAPSETAKQQARKQLEALDKQVLDFRTKFFADHPASFATKVFRASLDPVIPEAPKLANGRPDSVWQYRYYKKHYFDNFDFTDERLVRTPFFHDKIERYFKTLVVQHPDSINKEADYVLGLAKNKEAFKYILWHVFRTYETSEIMGMDAVMVYLAEKYYLTGKEEYIDAGTVKNIRNRVNIVKPLLLGKKAPNMMLTDSTGKVIPLHGVKAKYTILYFWDSDCGHCQKETPRLYEYFEKAKAQGVMVYAVNIKRKPEGWKKYLRKHKLRNWINVQDGQTVTDFKTLYDVYSTPVVYVLDEQKTIIGKRLGVEQLEGFISDQMKKK